MIHRSIAHPVTYPDGTFPRTPRDITEDPRGYHRGSPGISPRTPGDITGDLRGYHHRVYPAKTAFWPRSGDD